MAWARTVTSLGQCFFLVIFESAWTTPDITMIGNSSETVRRGFPVIVLLLAQLRSASCALLTVSSEEPRGWLPVHADVMYLQKWSLLTRAGYGPEPTEVMNTHCCCGFAAVGALYHRRSRSPSIALGECTMR